MELKDMLLGSRNYRIKTVKVSVWDPEAGEHVEREIGLKQPTYLEAETIKANALKAKTPEANARVAAQMAVACVCDAASGAPMFEEANIAAIAKSQVTGGWLSAVTDEVFKFMKAPVLNSTCAEPAIGDDGKPVLGADGKPMLCGCELVPGKRFCPGCGAEVPPVLEQVQRS